MISKAEIALVRSLADKRGRTENNMFVVEGRKMVEELTESTFEIEKIYTTETTPYIHGRECTVVGAKEMERLSQLKTPTNYLALARIPARKLHANALSNKLVLALDDVQDPGNVGTIIRLADWFGIDTILCSEATADCYNPKVVQATMGALLRVEIHYCDLTKILPTIGGPVYGTFLEGDNIYKAPLTSHGVIVMGNEGRGIGSAIEALTTHKLFIPPFPAEAPTSESLNVATATAIICSEFRRR